VLLSHSQMMKYTVSYPDAALVAVKDERGYRFWMDGGSGAIDGVPGRPWSFMSGGPGLEVDKSVVANVQYWEDYPCPTFAGANHTSFSYKDGCVSDADDWHGGKALMWAGNVYKDPDSAGILVFIHMVGVRVCVCVCARVCVCACVCVCVCMWGGALLEGAIQRSHGCLGLKPRMHR
jgi:hypothetical protein